MQSPIACAELNEERDCSSWIWRWKFSINQSEAGASGAAGFQLIVLCVDAVTRINVIVNNIKLGFYAFHPT